MTPPSPPPSASPLWASNFQAPQPWAPLLMGLRQGRPAGRQGSLWQRPASVGPLRSPP